MTMMRYYEPDLSLPLPLFVRSRPEHRCLDKIGCFAVWVLCNIVIISVVCQFRNHLHRHDKAEPATSTLTPEPEADELQDHGKRSARPEEEEEEDWFDDDDDEDIGIRPTIGLPHLGVDRGGFWEVFALQDNDFGDYHRNNRHEWFHVDGTVTTCDFDSDQRRCWKENKAKPLSREERKQKLVRDNMDCIASCFSTGGDCAWHSWKMELRTGRATQYRLVGEDRYVRVTIVGDDPVWPINNSGWDDLRCLGPVAPFGS